MERRELVARLDEVLSRRVALVCAPAGFGKTWLTVTWLRFHRDTATAWVTVDDHDNNASRLVSHVLEAVDHAIPAFDISIVRSPGGGVDANDSLDEIIHGLERWGHRLLLVLDDAHLIQSPAAVDAVTRLVATLPAHVRVVLVARHDPMTPLARLRVAGELVELRADDLRLTADEATRLVAATFERPVSDAAVLDFLERTGGWVTGFRLAAIAVGTARDPDAALAELGGGEKIFAEYLMTEVLATLERDVCEFLLETSVVEGLSGDLCDALTGRSDSATMLERLVDDELFTVRTESKRGWYRYHELFRDLLRTELRREHPESLAELHRRAGHWHLDHGDLVAAIRHALAAGLADDAANWLVAGSGSFFETGQIDTLIALGRDIERAIDPTPLSLLGTMAAAGMQSRVPREEADRLLAQFEARLAVEVESVSEPDRSWDWPGFVFPFHQRPEEILAVVRVAIGTRTGDMQLILDQAGCVPSESGYVEGAVGRTLTFVERYAEAEPLLQAFLDSVTHAELPVPHTRARAAGLLAMSWAGAGRLVEADRLATMAVDALRSPGPDRFPPIADMSLALAEIAWERGELAAAGHHTDDALVRSVDLGEITGYALAVCLRARIRGSRGDRYGAEAELRRSITMPGDAVVPTYFVERIAFERARLALQGGDLLGAELAVPDWRERVERASGGMREHLLLIRFLIAAGDDPTSLLECLPEGRDVSSSHQIQLGILRALAAHRADEAAGAVDALAAALELAAHTGHRQRFLDERAALGSVLDDASVRTGFNWDIDQAGAGGAIDLRDGARLERAPIAFVEPLTYRELEVLRLLPTHRTLAEIGEELYVSVNTVKYHVKAIYRKLGAENRADAVTIAKDCDLVPTSS